MADYQGSTTNPAFRDMTQTPQYVYEALNAEFNFCLDAAALPETTLHENYLTPEIDALNVSLGDYIPDGIRNPFVWLNPPYSDIGPWIDKCLKEKECGIGSVVLIPEDASAEWWPGDLCSEIRRVIGYRDEKGRWKSGRIHFINAETGEEMKSNPKGSNFLIFIPNYRGPCVTRHISKGDLLTIGNSIINLKSEYDQKSNEYLDQSDTDIEHDVDFNEISESKADVQTETLIKSELDNIPCEDETENEQEEDYSDKTVEQIHDEHPDTWQRTMIMLSVLFGRKEAYSHREIQFAGSSLLTDGEMTGTIAEYENTKAIDEALTKFSVWHKPSATVAHCLVCGMLDNYKYPANKTLTENLKLLERLHASEEPVLEALSIEGADTDVCTKPEPELAEELTEHPVMSSEWLREKYMQLEDYPDLLADLQEEIIEKTIQAIGDINDEYSSDPSAPKAEEFIEDFIESEPSIRTYMNIRSLRAAFRNLVSNAIKDQAA